MPGAGAQAGGAWGRAGGRSPRGRREPEGRQARSPPQGLSPNSCARLTQQRPSRWGWDLARGSDLPHPCRGAPGGHSGRPQAGQQRLVVMEK